MAIQALYLRWRPTTFEDVVGQEHVTYTVRNALISGRVGHAYLFAGPRGTGKTTMARLLAKAANCTHEDPQVRPCNVCPHCVAVNENRFLDLIEIDAASHTSVDDVRDLRDRIAFAPNEGQYKVYIVDEVHRFSGAAFDALLKTIEEPPDHAIFVLATTEIHKVPQTILSRCQRFEFRRIPLYQIVERLTTITEHEGVQVEPAALELVARQATGSLRDAVSLLDQLIAEPGEVLTLSLAQAILGTAASQSVRDITGMIAAGDRAGGLYLINEVMDQGTDPRQFSRQMVDYLRLVMLIQTGGGQIAETTASPDEIQTAASHAEQIPRRALLSAIDAFNDAATNSKSGWQPQLPVELAFLQSVEALFTSEVPAPVPTQPQTTAEQQEHPPAAAQPVEETSEEVIEEVSGPSVIDFSIVHKQWDEVINMTRQADPMVQALLNSGQPVAVEGNAIIFQVPGEFLCEKIEKDVNRRVIEQVLAHLFNEKLTIRCRVGGSAAKGGHADHDDLVEDSLASFAVNELGGQVKSVTDSEED